MSSFSEKNGKYRGDQETLKGSFSGRKGKYWWGVLDFIIHNSVFQYLNISNYEIFFIFHNYEL